MKIKQMFDKPKVIGVIADVNEGKSNLIYHILDELNQENKFKLYTFGLRKKIPRATIINSINEMENIKNSILIIDEMITLFDLDNRKAKRSIENTLRLINHNNNILLLCGLGENFKKFLSAKVDIFIYKKIKFEDLINGSKVKNIIMDYKGIERGTTLLNLAIDEALVYDGTHYNKIDVPYMKEFDSKKENVSILCPKNVEKKKCEKKCENIVPPTKLKVAK